jgi:hypothetical protein
MEIVTETLQQYLDQGYRIFLHCDRCQERRGEMDLASLCAIGYGERLLRQSRIRCPKCQERLSRIIQPPEKDGLLKDGRPIAYR